MRRNSHFSLALALMAGVATTMSFALPTDAAHAVQKKKKKKKGAETPKYDLTDAYRTAFGAAQAALEGEDNAAAVSALQALESAATKPDEKYLTGQLYLNLAVKTNNEEYQKRALKLSLDSGRTPQEDIGLYNATLGRLTLTNDKDYEAAKQYLAAAAAAGYENYGMYYHYAEAKFGSAIEKSGGSSINAANVPEAQEGLKYLERALRLAEGKQGFNRKALYKRGANIAIVTNSPDAASWLKNYVKAEQGVESWYLALSQLRRQARYENQDNLDLMRLMRRTKSMRTSADYAEYTDNAGAQRLPGEVSTVLAEGTSAGLVNSSDQYFSSVLSTSRGAVSQDRASLGSSERAARSASHGRIALATGDAYLGYGQLDKAVAMYELAMTKGDIDRDRALTRLGIALSDKGDYAAAREKFSMVSGVRKPLADLWLLWVNQNDTAATAQAQPAPAG
ncbi:hypothetical protein [Sphingorhabdus sp. Alg239-R122]|uniref:hypothetical protein n=1 Tax=Sphingorhabdus sp. Alg239-R122 TaxID=2305989 RepID=UPI0013DB5394|nr:hypothetical protein [Sphingorhabdus sp. Alg239-R122]